MNSAACLPDRTVATFGNLCKSGRMGMERNFYNDRAGSPFSLPAGSGNRFGERPDNPENLTYGEKPRKIKITPGEVRYVLNDAKRRYGLSEAAVSIAQEMIEALFSSAAHGVTIGAITKVLGTSVGTALATGLSVGVFALVFLGLGIIAKELILYGSQGDNNKPTPSSRDRSHWPDPNKGNNAA